MTAARLKIRRVFQNGKHAKFKISFLALAAVFSLVLSGCASTAADNSVLAAPDEKNFIPETFCWEKMADSVSYFKFENRLFPIRYHCLKIDLSAENLKISGYPKTESENHRGITGKKLARLLSGEQTSAPELRIIINTSPFAGKNGKFDLWTHIFPYRNIVGIHKVEGALLSDENARYAAIAFSEKNDCEIFEKQDNPALKEFDCAFGGFFQTLKNGEAVNFPQINDTRMAMGLSADRKTLFVLAVEGEIKSKSKGLSYPECSEIFLRMGAEDAVQLDGGGSTTLIVNGKNLLSYPMMRKNGSFMVMNFY